MGKLRILREVWEYLGQQKKFWLMGVMLILGLLGLMLVFAESTPLAPFIYTMF